MLREIQNQPRTRSPLLVASNIHFELYYIQPLPLVSCLRSSLNKSPGCGSLVKAYHPESFVSHSEPFGPCHPEQSEGSDPAQGRLCGGSRDELHEGSRIA